MDKIDELREKRAKQERNENKLFYGCLLFIVTVILSIWLFNLYANCETTTDAIIEGRLISAVPRVEGAVTRLNVIETQEVKKGDLLVEVDVSRYEYKLKLAEANLNTAKIKYASAMGKYYENLDDAYESAPNMESRFKFSKIGYDKFIKTHNSINSAEYVSEKDKSALLDKKNDPKEEKKSNQEVSKNENQINIQKTNKNTDEKTTNTEIEEEKINPEELRLKIKKLETDIAEYKLAISYSKIYAPCDGTISNITISEGDYVYIAQKLITIIPKHVWINANYDKSQIDNIQIGQPVRIKIHEIKGKTFKGVVDNIERNGTEFYDISQETTINKNQYEKITVKIFFTEDYSEYNLKPGMYVTPYIKIK